MYWFTVHSKKSACYVKHSPEFNKLKYVHVMVVKTKTGSVGMVYTAHESLMLGVIDADYTGQICAMVLTPTPPVTILAKSHFV